MNNNEIPPAYEALYISSMLWHTKSAYSSIKVIKDWLDLVENDDARALELPKQNLFEQLQNILHQAGCISCHFFPVKQATQHVQRANQLRQVFEIQDESPLKDRKLRNALEHFDEQIDNYLAKLRRFK
nr:hypothetical protein [uncultured Deefgea sp.]